MNTRIVFAIAITITVVLSGSLIYVQYGAGDSNYTNPSLWELKAGTHITITRNDKKMLGGADIVNFQTNGYYAVEYNLNLKNYSIITGSWNSSEESVVWVLVNGAVYMGTPLPDTTQGMLNQTLIPGHYTLVIGGHPDDVITISKPIQVQSYVPHRIDNFSIPAGTYINSSTTYSFYLNQPGQMVGDITTPAGIYSFSLYNSSGYGFSTSCLNASSQLDSFAFNLSPNLSVFGPGYFNLTFSSGFYISKTLEFQYYYDYSII